MPKRLIIPMILAALAVSPARGAELSVPAKIVDQFETALSVGNLDAALAWCAPDLVIRERAGAEIREPAQVRDYLSAMIRHRYRVGGLGREAVGNRVAFTNRVSFDDLNALGVDSVEAKGSAVVEGGKVREYTPAFCPGSILLLGSAAAKQAESLVRSLTTEIWGGKDPDAAGKYLAPGFVDHNPFPASGADRDGFVSGLQLLRTAVPDLKMTVEQVVSAGDLVAVRGVLTGTHQGAYMDKPATFRQIRIEMIEILRMDGGRVAERWAETDTLGLYRDFGLLDSGVKGKAKARSKAKEGKTGGILGWFFNIF
jgi:predicted ester cyclase